MLRYAGRRAHQERENCSGLYDDVIVTHKPLQTVPIVPGAKNRYSA